jgi:phage terminase large subunit-like protein
MSEPTYRRVDTGSDEVALEVLDFADAVGLPLDDWQKQVLTDWTLVGGDGKWAHRQGCLIVPRQAGKTHAVTIRILHALFFGHERHILYSAHRFPSATAQFREMVAVINNNDDLRKRVKRLTSSSGNELIQTVRGGELAVQSRTNTMTSQTRGRNFDLAVLDEALVLNQQYMSALLPTMSSRANPQLLYVSSGGDHDSEVLAQVRRAGYEGVPGLAFSEWAASDEDDESDPAVWAKTNPSFPVRPTPEAVGQELAVLPRSAFRRERLGIWSTGVPEPAIQFDVWQRCVEPSVGFPEHGGASVAVDVSVGPSGERSAAVAVAWRDEAGALASVLVETGAEVGWLPQAVSRVAERFGVYSVRFCPGGATDVEDALQQAGIEVDRVPFSALRGAAARLAELIGAAELRAQYSEALNHAVRTVPRARESSNEWRFSSKSLTPACPLVALSLAVVAAESAQVPEPAIW